MSKALVNLLTKTKTILKPKGAWTQDAYVRDKTGLPLPVNGKGYIRNLKDGCSFCLGGALYKAGCTDAQFYRVIDAFATTLGKHSENVAWIALWNDTEGRTKRQVIALLDKTIKRLSTV